MTLLAFLVGLSAGSFLNVLVYRQGKHFARGRSACPACSHELSWSELVPVLSFCVLGGRCRHCQARISYRYPVVELGVGLLFALPVFLGGFPFLELLVLWGVLFFLAFVASYDASHLLIPDKALFGLAIFSIIWRALFAGELVLSLLSGLVASGLFFAIFFFSQGKWMGFGDVKLVFVLGFLLSFPASLVALALAVFTGALVGMVQITFCKKTLASQIPFGPFLALGAASALFFTKAILFWYLAQF